MGDDFEENLLSLLPGLVLLRLALLAAAEMRIACTEQDTMLACAAQPAPRIPPRT